MASYIEALIEDTNKTHANLGNLVAILQIAVKARKMVLVVSPSGCGKSTAMSLIASNTKDSIMPDRLSIAGLAAISDKLTGFRSAIVVDDIATTQTPYARQTTVTALVALVYTHRIESIMMGVAYCIEDFFGSALVGIQPILLRGLMLLEEWDASIQDKVLRYYHLYRPIQPALMPPSVQMEDGLSIDLVEDFEPDGTNIDWLKLITLADSQWSRARAKEHLRDMLKAVAALENRTEVIKEDYSLLLRLLKPMAYENIVVNKEELEGDRQLDNNLLALLAEYCSYNGQFALAQVAHDYKISLSQCYRIMSTQKEHFNEIHKSPTFYVPSKKLYKLLKTFDLQIEGNEDGNNID